jgi:hypothetical protein
MFYSLMNGAVPGYGRACTVNEARVCEETGATAGLQGEPRSQVERKEPGHVNGSVRQREKRVAPPRQQGETTSLPRA